MHERLVKHLGLVGVAYHRRAETAATSYAVTDDVTRREAVEYWANELAGDFVKLTIHATRSEAEDGQLLTTVEFKARELLDGQGAEV